MAKMKAKLVNTALDMTLQDLEKMAHEAIRQILATRTERDAKEASEVAKHVVSLLETKVRLIHKATREA